MKNMTAQSTINIFKKIFMKNGLPFHVVTDSGTQLRSDECNTYFKKLGIKHTYTAPNHPATNGAVEGFVKSFKRKIKTIVQSQGVDVKMRFKNFYSLTEHQNTRQQARHLQNYCIIENYERLYNYYVPIVKK